MNTRCAIARRAGSPSSLLDDLADRYACYFCLLCRRSGPSWKGPPLTTEVKVASTLAQFEAGSGAAANLVRHQPELRQLARLVRLWLAGTPCRIRSDLMLLSWGGCRRLFTIRLQIAGLRMALVSAILQAYRG
jgi:hypothetical protein